MERHEIVTDFSRIVAGWKRYFALWIALAVGLAAILTGVGIFQRRKMYGGDAKALIAVNLSEDLRGKTENITKTVAEIADITRIQSPAIVTRAMNNLGLYIGQLDKVRSGITVQDVLSDQDYEQIMAYRTMISKNSLSLEAAQQASQMAVDPTWFIVSLNYEKTGLSPAEAAQLLDEIIRCYQEAFQTENNEMTFPEGVYAEVPTGYTERVLFLRDQLESYRDRLQKRIYIEETGEGWKNLSESFYAWRGKKQNLLPGMMRSRTTGFSALDLLDETELLMNTDLCNVAARIWMGPVVTDSVEMEQTRLQTRLEEAAQTRTLLQRRYSTLEDTVKTYERVPVLSKGVQDETLVQTDTYDQVINEMLSLQEETAGISRTIQEAQKQKARLETADGASAAEADQVAALLEAVEKKVRILGEQLTVMVEDYRKSAFRENTVKLLVAASAPEAEMISGQWRRTILILEAVLLIAWLGAGVGYGLKQSSVAGAKRYQESGEDSAD